MTEISDREQRRLGLDLHDGICQQLVSVAFAADILRKDLMVKSPPDALRLARITGLLDNAIIQARTLSQALYPVNLVGSGLGFALGELANRTGQGRQFICQANCDEDVTITNHALATHLYHIAQEAVQNAAQHADPSHITMSLARRGDSVCLTITDDGVAVDEERKFGFGLSIDGASTGGYGGGEAGNPPGRGRGDGCVGVGEDGIAGCAAERGELPGKPGAGFRRRPDRSREPQGGMKLVLEVLGRISPYDSRVHG